MIDDNGEMRLEVCPRRDANTLGQIVAKNLAVGSLDWTDEWRGYRRLTNLGFVHSTVKHSRNFVDPDGVHTQRIECEWRQLRRLVSQGGIRHEDIADFLIEYAWRRKCKREEMDPFVALLIALKLN